VRPPAKDKGAQLRPLICGLGAPAGPLGRCDSLIIVQSHTWLSEMS
jgi:hypothetical protein